VVSVKKSKRRIMKPPKVIGAIECGGEEVVVAEEEEEKEQCVSQHPMWGTWRCEDDGLG